MQIIFYVPPGTVLVPSLENYHLISAYAGEARLMLIDSRMVQWKIIPDEPEPPETPAPPETELYKVVTTGRLNVRADHSTSAAIVGRLEPQQEFPVEKDATFEGEGITWRKTYPQGHWVATQKGNATYAIPVDASSRAG